jgi:hypothetical protein
MGQVQGGPVDFCHWTNCAEPTGPTGRSPLGHSRPSNAFGPIKARQPWTADFMLTSATFLKKSFSIFKIISKMIYKRF